MGGREILEDNPKKRIDSEGCGEGEQMSKEKKRKKGTYQCGALIVFVRQLKRRSDLSEDTREETRNVLPVLVNSRGIEKRTWNLLYHRKRTEKGAICTCA
jgi:predicted nucleic acid-binding Zn ribbon protein